SSYCVLPHARRRHRPRYREVLAGVLNLVVDVLVGLRWLRRLVDALRLDAAPQQLPGLCVLEINRQRAAQLLLDVTCVVTAIVPRSPKIRRSPTVRIVNVLHLVGTAGGDGKHPTLGGGGRASA